MFTHIYFILAITVMFNEPMYSVNENAGPAQPVLVLNSSSETAITVQVTYTDGSAAGEYCNINYSYYNGMTNMLQEEEWIILLKHTWSNFLPERPMLHLISP